MREIKFRMLYDRKEMSYSDDYISLEGFFNFYERHSKPKHLMQYTGLKDKNGKEIYEGDILGYWGTACWEVLWDKNKGSWRFGNCVTNFPMTETKRKEIIGNIYENPELLN